VLISVLYHQWRKARETYEQAISMWREYKEKEVECDRLQRIHTLENLAWLLEQGHCTPEELSGGPWRNAASLREQVSGIYSSVEPSLRTPLMRTPDLIFHQ
jgi:hypothetical protein